ncbi:MAG: rhodanese-like domain-containing protein [Verrucomicrobiales bacterium]|nr:rhodanese-like domain-containing protein [Verrucomicrobiales bacterium]
MRRTMFPRLGAWLAVASLYVFPVNAQSWESVLETVRRRFPSVRQLSTRDLATWLAVDPKTAERPKPVLLDTRSAEEYGVSHLPGARHADTVEAVRALGFRQSDPVVVYCSVGYRSSALAEKLSAAGWTNVWNLEGSIFAWANEGRLVHRAGKPADEVHPYDAKWGALLKPEHHPGARVPKS